MDPKRRPFKLRTIIQSHSSDIRCVTAYPQGEGFITASRDKLSKVYLSNKKNREFLEAQCFRGPEHYISTVAVLENHVNNEMLIYVGSNDSIIYAFDLNKSESQFLLHGHCGTVCSLAASNLKQLLASGSWDNDCIVWKENKMLAKLSEHQGAVWSVAFIGDEKILTASADKTLKLWQFSESNCNGNDASDNSNGKVNNGKCLITYSGHTDCVRGIAVISADEFLSCSNDATVRQWKITGETIMVHYGHENFIYSIDRLSYNEFITCSEDRSVRVWINGVLDQTIRLPAPTLWSIAAIGSENFVVGASNGKVYVFTRDAQMEAPLEEQVSLEDEVSSSVLPMTELGDIKISELPGKEVLLAPGKKDGQTKLVRDGNNVTVHQWSVSKMEWMKVGDVVGSANSTNDPSQKVKFEDKEYDFVFDVDIEDGVPPLKLPYNVTDDPWFVSQQFIHKHNLSQLYLDQIANFIVKNSQNMVIQQAGSGTRTNFDPFTGDSSYIPKTTSEYSFTEKTGSLTFFPQKTYIYFEVANIEGITKKLKEFADSVPPELRLTIDDIQTLLKLTSTAEVIPDQIRLIKQLISWPKAFIFPALDLLRLTLLLPKINEELCNERFAARLIDNLLTCATDFSSTPNQMLSLRCLSNAFRHKSGQEMLIKHALIIFQALNILTKCQHRNTQIALSTVYLNYSVYLSSETKLDIKIECCMQIASFLKVNIDGEAKFRLLVALATLLETDKELQTLSKSEDLINLINTLTVCSNPIKVGQCATNLLKLLK